MEQLGIQPVQLLAQILNFLILAFVLSKFLYKPILTTLENRRKKIQEGLEYTQKLKLELEKNEKKRQEIILKAKEEAKKIIEEGKKAGRGIEKEIVEKAHRQASEIIEKAKKDLEMERLVMQKQLKAQTVDVAKTWVEAVLRKVLNKKTQKSIVQKTIKE